MSFAIPANTAEFFEQLTAIVAFDIIEVGETLVEILDLLPKDPVNEKFEAIGLESMYFLSNLGSLGLVLAFKILLVILWLTLHPM